MKTTTKTRPTVTVYADPLEPARLADKITKTLCKAGLRPIEPVEVSQVVDAPVAVSYDSESSARRCAGLLDKASMSRVSVYEPDDDDPFWLVCFVA